MMACFSSAEMRWSGWLTPWRMLWMFLVMRNTPGRGFGTARGYQKCPDCCGKQTVALTIPSQVNAHETCESHQGVTHQSDTASLRSGAEESDLGLIASELLGVRQHGFPSRGAARILVVLDGGEVSAEASVGLDYASPPNLEKRDERGTKVPSAYVSRLEGRMTSGYNLHDALACHRICLLIYALDIPKRLFLVLVIRAHDDGHNIQL